MRIIVAVIAAAVCVVTCLWQIGNHKIAQQNAVTEQEKMEALKHEDTGTHVSMYIILTCLAAIACALV